MLTLPPALQAFAAYPQFVTYIIVPSQTRPGKTDKLPTSPITGEVINAHDSAHWTTSTMACAAAQINGAAGVGYVFTQAAGFFFLDIDSCLTEQNTWSPIAQHFMAALPGAAVEVSSSGRGLHIFGRGLCPPHVSKNAALGIELYTDGRFAALTGTHATGDAGLDCSAVLPWLVDNYFPPNAGSGADLSDWSTSPVAQWRGPTDDAELLRRALKSRSLAATFGKMASFSDLWDANVDALSRTYPDTFNNPPHPYDASSADAALAQHLAFWTGNDMARMEVLMRKSALVREKWERDDYIKRTIKTACARQTEWLVDKVVAPAVMPTAAPTSTIIKVNPSETFLSPADQMNFFKGWVYVAAQNCIWTPDGVEYDQSRLNNMFNGRTFALDDANEKVTTDCWKAAINNQSFRIPRAHQTMFRPEEPNGALLAKEGLILLNCYVPINTYRVHGDPTPFLTLMRKILPDPRDLEIVLSYAAACVQYPGTKFQWWPVLQGTEGNGKSTLARCIIHAVGSRYSHSPNTDAIAKSGSKFNSWVRNKLFLSLEEIYVPERRDFLNAFKATVTNDRLEIEGKGIDQIMGDNRANGMMSTNYRDGVPVDIDGRRYAVFFTAQQSKKDLERDGYGGRYMPDLYDWLKGVGKWKEYGSEYGFAVVNDYLRNYHIADEFNPAGACQVAPITSSTGAAIQAGLGTVEQEVMEAIGQGVPGFRGGWVSSMALDKLLTQVGASRRVPPSRRKDMLATLGYEPHPGLLATDGRTNNPVLPDGGKPKLFIKTDNPYRTLTVPGEIARAYSSAQLEASP